MQTMQDMVMDRLHYEIKNVRTSKGCAITDPVVQWYASNVGNVYPHLMGRGRMIHVDFQSSYCSILLSEADGKTDVPVPHPTNGTMPGHMLKYAEGEIPAHITRVVAAAFKNGVRA